MIAPRALLAMSLALTACNESSFTGSTATKPIPVAKPATATPGTLETGSGEKATAPTAPTPPQAAVVPPGCGADGATQARLLTPEIDVTAPDAHLEYEVYRTDCDGTIQAFVADKIFFDMDSYGAYSDMQATLAQDGAGSVPTTLKLTVGSDLFGHIGAGWAHQETIEKVELKGTSKSVRLRIELAGRNLTPREAPAGGAAADGSVPVPTYLRFGNAAPIKVDVKALHTKPVAAAGATVAPGTHAAGSSPG